MKKNISLSIVTATLLATNSYAQTSEDLGMITVSSATKSEQSIKDITSNVEVITGAELEEKHITTLSDALNLVSGISFTQNGGLGSSTSINLRGSDNNRVLVLIDGVKVKDHSSINGTDISQLLIHNIEKIEIIKGAQSGIWGADASAGVINIITKTPKDGNSGTLLAEFGSFKTTKYGGELTHKSKDGEIGLNFLKLKSDGFTTQAPKGEDIEKYEDDSYENKTVGFKTKINLSDETTVGFGVTHIDALKEYDSYNNPNDTTIKNDTKSDLLYLAYNQTYKQHDIALRYESGKIQKDQIGTTWGVKLTKSESSNLEIKDNITYNEEDFIVMGAGQNSDKIEFTRADATTGTIDNNGNFIYATNSNNFEKIILTESLRYDNYDNFSSATTGKIGAKYNLQKDFSLFANLGTAYTTPLLIQNINPWGATNMEIKPEESRSFDIGLEYKNLKVTYFEHKIQDMIEWFDPTPTNYYNNDAIYKNLDGENILKGYELDYKQSLSENIFGNISYTHLSAKDKDGKDLIRRAKENLKFGIDYYMTNKLTLGVNGEYIGERFDDSAKTKQTGKYTVANANINYTISKMFETYLKIENVTDKYYQTVNGYTSSPRAFYAGVKVNF